MKIDEKSIGITYFAEEKTENEILHCENELRKVGITLQKINLSGTIFNSAFDFAGLDSIIISSVLLLQQLATSATYDLLKATFVKLWSAMRNANINQSLVSTSSVKPLSQIPFCIKGRGIPTPAGVRNITFTISGDLSEEDKTLAISRIFDVVQQVAVGSRKLNETTKIHEAFDGANLMKIDPHNLSISEIDIDEELNKKIKS